MYTVIHLLFMYKYASYMLFNGREINDYINYIHGDLVAIKVD